MDHSRSRSSTFDHVMDDEPPPDHGYVSDLLIAAASLGDGSNPTSNSLGAQGPVHKTGDALASERNTTQATGAATGSQIAQRDEGEASRKEHEDEANNDAAGDKKMEEADAPDNSAEDVVVGGSDGQVAAAGGANALETVLDDLVIATGEDNTPSNEQNPAQQESAQEAEWEVDSSPYESSSESDSSDSSDDSSSDNDEALLGPEETARLLMAGDFDDGEEPGGKGGKSNSPGHYRSKNELPEMVIPKPAVTITDEMNIEPLGSVLSIVENTVVVQSNQSGEVKALGTGSVLCLENRTIVGALAETLGSVRKPLYTICFDQEEEIRNLGLEIGVKIFYSTLHTEIVWMKDIKDIKGSDASNLHDEEVDQDEMEFSDDEKEAEHKRLVKLKKRNGKPSRDAPNQRPQPHPLRNVQLADDAYGAGDTHTLTYDDDDDGPYRPLTRPSGFGHAVSPTFHSSHPLSLPPRPENTAFNRPTSSHSHRGPPRGGGRGGFRGRGNRYSGGGRDDRRQERGGRGGYVHSQGRHSREGSNTTPPRASFSVPAQQPQQSQQQPPQHARSPNPPFASYSTQAQQPAPMPWSSGPNSSSVPYTPAAQAPAAYPRPPTVQASRAPVPPTSQFNFPHQPWQAPAQQYQFPQASSHSSHPPPPQQAQPAAYTAASAPRAWPGAGPAGSYINPNFTGRQQDYWGEQQNNAYGHGLR